MERERREKRESSYTRRGRETHGENRGDYLGWEGGESQAGSKWILNGCALQNVRKRKRHVRPQPLPGSWHDVIISRSLVGFLGVQPSVRLPQPA